VRHTPTLRQMFTSLLIVVAEYCDERVCLCVCLFVCLSVRDSANISLAIYVRTSPNFVCILPMAVSRLSLGDNTICYILPVLWMTSCLRGKARATTLRRLLRVTCRGTAPDRRYSLVSIIASFVCVVFFVLFCCFYYHE